MWSDNETADDLIGFRVHAELIADVVSDSKLLPVTMGVFGDWGNGKTSIMKMLEARLGEREDVAVLYFDAWLFEGYDDAKSALISSILKQLANHKRFPEALKDKAANLLGRVNWMRVMKMGWDNVALPAVLAYAIGGATAIPGFMASLKGLFSAGKSSAATELTADNMESLLKPSSENEITEVRDFREAFGDLLQKTGFKSLVVLIDDLDRCSPERIVENLEAIKLFLNVGNTAFVIGADPRIVRHAIAVRYRESLQAAAADSFGTPDQASEQLVRDYVEKLIQIPYHLPRLSPAEIESYMTLLFAQRDLSAEHFKRCVEACEKRRIDNRFVTFGLADLSEALKGEALPRELSEALSFTAGAAPMFTDNLKGNPRQVKRFLNAFTLRRKLSKVAGMESLRDDVLLKLMLLEYSAEERFKELAAWHQAQNQTPQQVLDLESGSGAVPEGWDRDHLKRWIAMEPQLSKVDLSDYFWLVRDRLASSLLGLTLVPPLVRKTYDGLFSEMGRKVIGPTLKELRADETDSLFGLLAKHVQRDPEDDDAYRALFTLAEARNETMLKLVALIKQLPVAKVPPAVSPLLTILAQKPGLKNGADELIDHLSKHGGKAAKAARIERK